MLTNDILFMDYFANKLIYFGLRVAGSDFDMYFNLCSEIFSWFNSFIGDASENNDEILIINSMNLYFVNLAII